MEFGKRESHLMIGLAIQIFVITVFVFGYTQALRQVNYQRDLCMKLREQLAGSREQVKRYDHPDLEKVRAQELRPWEAQVPAVEDLGNWGERFASFARNEFGLGSLEVRPGTSPEESIKIPQENGKAGVELQLYGLELEGIGTTHNLALFLESLRRSDVKLLYSLESIKLRIADPAKVSAVHFRLKWRVATRPMLPSEKDHALAPFEPHRTDLKWGPREEPFLPPAEGTPS